MSRKINLKNAKSLWEHIIEFADDEFLLGGEGNSGEFSSDTELKHLTKARNLSLKKLCKKFHQTTCWKPVFVKGTVETDFNGHWIFKR